MAIVETEGIVTKEIKYGDTSRILTVITKDLGKISVLAGNVRRGKSGLLTATALFAHSRFTLFKGGTSSLYKLNEGELLTSFAPLRGSLEGMAFASYFCDITNFVVQEDAVNSPQAELLLRALYLLCRDNPQYEKIKAVFELRTLTLEGLLPDPHQCSLCGADSSLACLDIQSGEVLCKKCGAGKGTGFPVNDSLLSAISYIACAEDKKEFAFNMSEKAIDYLSRLGEQSIEILLEKSFKTLDYLRKVTSLG